MPFAQINEKELYYTWSPAKDGSEQPGLTILLIHGLGSSSSFYATVIPKLLEAGFGCLAFDTHGWYSQMKFGVTRTVRLTAPDN
jgi:alpha-beta hydrolase superfamily lysophospholipase